MNNKLNVLLSDLVVFYHKLQNKHWYVSGQSFFQIHPEL
ncbi:MAG: DNA starvation/stationary phase protection protein, partial [Solobacterium sp.]|nr:DNA starvation/stationary phase protection protein [Solobacterium sp.]